MVELGLIQFDERVVGENSPQYDDTLNRALVQIVDESGGDATAFVGFALRPTVAPTIGQFYRATDTVVGASWQTLTAAMVSDLSSASTGITKVGTIDTGVWHGTSIATTYTDAKIASVTGTADRITVGGSASAPTFDIASTYVGQATITTLGTIATGVWNGTAIGVAYTDAKVTIVTGTSNRITIGGTTPAPIVDISAAYVGQTSITTLGTVATGTWNATAIADTYLATISTAGKVSNSATTATAANTAATIVARDGSGNFAAGTITAALTGNVTGNLTGTVLTAAQASITTMTGLVTVGTIGTGVWQGTSIASTYTDAKVASISGTSNRVTVAGTSSIPVIDISASYVGQGSITTLGTIASGVWNGTVVGATYGGTGVNNGSSTITLAGNLVTAGAFSLTLTTTAGTNVTLPTSGTLVASTVTSLGSLTSVGGAFAINGALTGATTGAFSGILTTGSLIVNNSGNSGATASANKVLLDMVYGGSPDPQVRFTAYGPDASTNAAVVLSTRRSDGSNILPLLSFVPSTSTVSIGFGSLNLTLNGIISELVLRNDTSMYFRNAANSGAIAAVSVDAFDGVIIGGTGAAVVYVPVAASFASSVAFGGSINASGVSASFGSVQSVGDVNVLGSLFVPTHTPANAAATGTIGNITWDTGFLYVCVASNTWKRVAIATWP